MDRWEDIDSHTMHTQLGAAHVLLEAGRPFTIEGKTEKAHIIKFKAYTLNWFIQSGDEEPYETYEEYHIPTEDRLKEVGGEDWY